MQLGEDGADAVGVSGAGIAGGEDSRLAVEGIDLEAGIVC